MPHPCVRASGSGPGLWRQIQWPRVMWLHNPESRPNPASPPNAASATRRHHLMRRYQSVRHVSNSASPPNALSAIRRHHPVRLHSSSSPPNSKQCGVTTQYSAVRGQFGVTQCGVTIRRHLKQCGFRIRRQAVCHTSPSGRPLYPVA